RLIDAMLTIREEIARVEQGQLDGEDNPLRLAPHVMADLTGDWQRSYSTVHAVLPLPCLAANKYWPIVNRIYNVYGSPNPFGDWQRSYSREQAVFPLPWVAANKYWPVVNRIDNVYGDRNLFCACPPVEEWAQ